MCSVQCPILTNADICQNTKAVEIAKCHIIKPDPLSKLLADEGSTGSYTLDLLTCQSTTEMRVGLFV